MRPCAPGRRVWWKVDWGRLLESSQLGPMVFPQSSWSSQRSSSSCSPCMRSSRSSWRYFWCSSCSSSESIWGRGGILIGIVLREMCYICLEEGGELVYPCACTAGVHLKCLLEWQSFSNSRRCEICLEEYTVHRRSCIPAFLVFAFGFCLCALVSQALPPELGLAFVFLTSGGLLVMGEKRSLFACAVGGSFLYVLVCVRREEVWVVGGVLFLTSLGSIKGGCAQG